MILDHASRVLLFRPIGAMRPAFAYQVIADQGLPEVRNAGEILLGAVHRAYAVGHGRVWSAMYRGESIGLYRQRRIAALSLSIHHDGQGV